MKKIFFIFLILCLLPLSVLGSDLKVSGGTLQVSGGTLKIAQSSTDCPSCFFRSNWEGTGILDSSTWDSETGTTGHLSVATAQYLQGTHSLGVSSTAASEFDYLQEAITATGTLGVRFAIRINTQTATEFDLIEIKNGSTFIIILEYHPGTGGLFVYNANRDGYVGSAFALSLDTWYQVEVKFIAGTSISWRVWNAAGTTLVSAEQTDTVSVSALNANAMLFGMTSVTSVTNVIYWLDSFVADNAAYPGPYAP